MEFYQLEVFIAVAEEGSFSRAAERVFRTQSAVSQAVKKLEEELGSLLFDREAAALVPTETGRAVLEYAHNTVGTRNQFLQHLEQLKKARLGKVTIAAFESAALYILPEPLRTFHAELPEIEIEVLRQPDDVIPRQVLDRAAHVGFVTFDPPFRDLRSFKLFEDPLILIVPPGHRFADAPGLEVKHLADEHFFVHHVRTQTTQTVIGLFEAHGTPLRIAARLWSYENVKGFVKGGSGIAIVPAVAARAELAAGTLVRVPVAGLTATRVIHAIYSDERYLPLGAIALLDVLRSWPWPQDAPDGPSAAPAAEGQPGPARRPPPRVRRV